MNDEVIQLINKIDCRGAKAPRNDKTRHAGLDPASINTNKTALTPTLSHRRGSDCHPERQTDLCDSGSINTNQTDRSRVVLDYSGSRLSNVRLDQTGWVRIRSHGALPKIRKHGMTNILFAKQTEMNSLCFTPHFSHKRAAFTLAEVLITLGIIGIVAILTIPALVNRYQKKEVSTKLKVAYSILSNAMRLAELEHGEISDWDIAGISGTDTKDQNFSVVDRVNDFTNKYVLPYVEVVADLGYTCSLPYYTAYLPVSHTKAAACGRYLMLPNGILTRIGIGSSGCIDGKTNPDGSCVKSTYTNMMFRVDINGKSAPNLLGKDVFLMRLNLTEHIFEFHNFGTNITRDRIKQYCADDSGSQICGYLIFRDNFEIADDYPWW